METLVPFMKGAISKEDTFFGTILELVFVIWTKVWPTRTTEDFEKGVVRDLTKQSLKGCFHIKNTSRKPIDEKTSCSNRITPKPKREGCMCKKCETSFNNMSMFSFSNTVLLMCMRTRNTVTNANVLKERIKFNVFSTPVCLNMNNFMIKKALNMLLKLQKDMKHIGLTFEQIKPSEATETINKTDIILVSTHRSLGRVPYIRKDKLQRSRNYSFRK
jgi:hypothetical protein